MKKKTSTNEELKGILRSNKQMAKLSESSLAAVSQAIENSGIIIPKAADNIGETSTSGQMVQLSKFDIVLLALTSNPNKWYLVFSGKKPRQDIGLYQLGKCFEMIRRKENGVINHYARYTGGAMNAMGVRRMETLRKKMDKLGKAANSGSNVQIHNATPRFGGKPKGDAVSSLPKRSRKLASSKKKPQYSVEHAAMYPPTADEKTFLAFLDAPARVEHILSKGTKANDTWHSFRWKWQTRYGFDLSQISLRQEKQADGTYNIYGTYTPNAANMMNSGLKKFYDFLSTKGRKFAQANIQIHENEVIFG